MDAKHSLQLEQVHAYYQATDLVECYNILRRYFDRLPFKPEPAHGEYVGIFCRVLLELGKEFELKFYQNILEKKYEESKEPFLAYALATVYLYSSEPRRNQARALLESILKRDPSKILTAKAKMLLADFYLLDDLGSAKLIIESIQLTEDRAVDRLIIIWRAVIARREGHPAAAIDILMPVFSEVSLDNHWYTFVSASIVHAMALVDLDKYDEVDRVIVEIREWVKKKKCRSTTEEQLKELEKLLDRKRRLGVISLAIGEDEKAFIYGTRRIIIKGDCPSDKLLLHLLKKGFLDKTQIVRVLYGRKYIEADDKLIYYHMHSLRKKIQEAGLPAEAIRTDRDGYHLVPEVEIKRESA